MYLIWIFLGPLLILETITLWFNFAKIDTTLRDDEIRYKNIIFSSHILYIYTVHVYIYIYIYIYILKVSFGKDVTFINIGPVCLRRNWGWKWWGWKRMCGRVFEECGLKSSLNCAKAHGGVLIANENCFYFRAWTLFYNTADWGWKGVQWGRWGCVCMSSFAVRALSWRK